MTEQPVILTRAQVAQMTGWDLLTAVGIYDKERRSWSYDDMRTCQSETGRAFQVYSTRGRGRQARITYVHLVYEGQCRIVNPDGTPTGDHMPWTYHYRGKAADKVSTYREVS